MNSVDLQSLKSAQSDNTENPMIGYLNINNLQNKIIDLREFLKHISLDYFVLSETKLDNSFPCAQFQIADYEIRARRNRNQCGGGLIEFVKKGLICKRLKIFETVNSECICSELTISNKKWVYLSVYRPPSQKTLKLFFDELSSCLDKASETYENFIVMGGFNLILGPKVANMKSLRIFSVFSVFQI